jgi:hypothetical protein
MRAKMEEAGRDPDSLPITLFAWGKQDRGKLERFRDLGISQVLVGTGTNAGAEADSTMQLLDDLAPAIAAVA